MILDCPNWFGRVQIVLVGSKSFSSCLNHFCQVQIRLFWTNFYNLGLSKMIWTWPKWIGPVQIDWYSAKIYLDCPKSFWTHRRLCAALSKTKDFFQKSLTKYVNLNFHVIKKSQLRVLSARLRIINKQHVTKGCK